MGWMSEFRSDWWAVKKKNKLRQMWISPVWKWRWLELRNTKIVLGEIQRCSKRSVEISCLQMQTAGFDKCKTGKPANPDICSAQIHMYDFDKSMRACHTDGKCIYVRTFLHPDHHSHCKDDQVVYWVSHSYQWFHWSSVSKIWYWITNNYKEHELKSIYTYDDCL